MDPSHFATSAVLRMPACFATVWHVGTKYRMLSVILILVIMCYSHSIRSISLFTVLLATYLVKLHLVMKIK